MAKITYENKVALNTNSQIADKNKVNDSDMNEIKSVVNQNDTNVGDLADLNTSDQSSVVNSINEIVNNTEWKLAGTTTSTNVFNITVDYNELLIVCAQDINTFITYIPKFLLTSSRKSFNLGGRFTASNVGYGISGFLTLTSFRLEYVYVNTQNKTSSATVRIYYR